ncbi:hypothetical protein ABDK00_009480 [Niabella insulamsoli]|uniref:hypothetical protein n=1 Tax=Niabella insulamsoli TaxID=3144874 RepID=UPI0031FD77E5
MSFFKKINKRTLYSFLPVLILLMSACTKIEEGFISPTMQYSVKLLTISKGRIAKSNSLVPDGSSIPLSIKWVHIYDSTGKVVDDIFIKTYPVDVWTKSYNSLTDTSYAKIIEKRETVQLPPITVNPKSGVVESNSASLYIPSGTYTMDVEVSNEAGTQMLPKAMTLVFIDDLPIATYQQSAYSLSRLIANTATGANPAYYNGLNNPFIMETVKRNGDAPNLITIKVTDRNGVPFNPRLGEIAKRPNSGVNPNPPFLQNLEDYAPDTFVATDTALTLRYPLVPFPIASLGNGFNQYYRIPTAFVTMDSVATWPANATGPGIYYQGASDSRYLGTYKNDRYDYSLRFAARIFVPGSYSITLKLLNVTHR